MSELDITVIMEKDAATPFLDSLSGKLEDRTELNRFIADATRTLTAEYLTKVTGPRSRARTERRFAGTEGPLKHTNYFANKAKGVQALYDKDGVYVEFPTGYAAISNLSQSAGGSQVGSREAFARIDGPVTITAINARWLTLPAIAAAHGRKAAEFPFLKFIPFASGAKALARQNPGKKGREALTVFYWLKESITLPQDRSLLPSDAQYMQAAETGAQDFLASL